MLAPGTPAPAAPAITNLVSNCAAPGGKSLVTFTVGKAIAGAVLSVQLTADATGTVVWASGYGSTITSQPFAILGTPNGTYTLTADNGQATSSRPVVIACAPGPTCDLRVTVTAAAPTVAGTTGTLTLVVTTSAPPVQVYLRGLNLTHILAGPTLNLAAGTYTYQGTPDPTTPYLVEVTDAGGCQASGTATIPLYAPPVVPGCTDPLASNYDPTATVDNGACVYVAPVRVPFFSVPPAQSLRFVLPGFPGLAALDNTLLADEQPLDTTNPGYCQPVAQADTLVLQFHTNYAGPAAPTVQLQAGSRAGGAVALTATLTRVVQAAGQTAAFAAYLRPDPAGTPGRCRLYFNADTLPLPFRPGDRVTLTGLPGAGNGTYPLVAVLEDPAAAVPYLVLPLTYPGGAAQRQDCTLSSTFALQGYDTWQAVLPFAAVSAGFYAVLISVSDATFGAATALSEPVDVQASHADTVLVAWRNFDNAFHLNYSAGLVHRLRVKGRFFERETATQKDVLRESTGRLTLLRAAVQRKVRLDTYLLPAYRHEALAVAFCHDFIRVNGVEVLAEEAYAAAAVPRFTLSNGTALLEQADFLGAGNRDDVSTGAGVDTPGQTYLLANQTYLIVNP